MATGTVMNLGDPEWELIDPTPNVHSLFLNFDKVFFWTKLASRAVVRWSKRMYSCAGICSYEGRGGLCDIALSEPLLKLRPRKDLVETLLHEMIHAYLFITCRDQDRDGHGPNFKAHMHRINNSAGLNISIYHDFHDEVKLYQTHWWRCSGPCQYRKPYFGIVRRPMNKAPGPNDRWFSDHQRSCGGTFVKIKEPENKRKAAKTTSKSKNNGDITKYINNNNNNSISNNNISNKNILTQVKPILKDTSNQIKPKLGTHTNHGGAFLIPAKNINFKPQSQPPVLFSGKGVLASNNANKLQSSNVTETVRNIWANKNIPFVENKKPLGTPKRLDKGTGNKRLSNQSITASNNSPPKKINKIDDYFKKRASSVLTEVYGEQINISQSSDRKLVAVSSSSKQKVPCPICNTEVDGDIINSHIDECLNKDVIEKLSKDNITDVVSNHGTKVSPGANINKGNFVGTDKNRDFIVIKTEQDNMKSTTNGNKNIANDSIDLTFPYFKKNNNLSDSTPQLIDLTVYDFDYKNVKILNTVTDIVEANISDVYTATDAKAGEVVQQNCPCCDVKVEKPLNEHLDECSAFSDTSITDDGASTSGISSFDNDDDDDIFDETQMFNATGTKYPCPCCLKMIEQNEMNQHLDECLL